VAHRATNTSGCGSAADRTTAGPPLAARDSPATITEKEPCGVATQPEEFEADEEFVDDADVSEDAVVSEDADDELTLVDDLDLEVFEAVEDDDAEDAEDADDVAVVAVAEVLAVEEVEDDAEEEETDLDEETDDIVVEDEDEESLDVLLAREKATSEDDDLGRLEEPRDGLTVPAQPISADEFTCRSCFLVKNRAQLADEDALICLDCA